jgi:DNA modification methylase
MTVRVIEGDCLATLRTLPAETFQTCVTSPPYYGLRDYGHAGQIGLEESPDAYVARLVEVFAEVKRVLRPDAVAWINLGDCYGKGKQLLGIPWRVAFALQADGWYLRSAIVWAQAEPDARERHRPADQRA